MTELKPARAAVRADLRLALLACAAASVLATQAQAQAQTGSQAEAQPAAAAAPAPAAPMSPDADDVDAVVEELVVVAETREQPGAVVGDIPPEIQLGPREIRALGVSSVTELLDALAPQLASGRGRGGGRPITLVNGQRIASFREIRDLPTEAILRVDILPEEVALKYGYRADQRVVNFVLRPRFRALTTEAGAQVATAGGREAYDATANILRIQRDTRLQVDLKAAHSTPLLESERDIMRSDTQRPFDLTGNVTASPFGPGEIDPALTAVAGRPLTVVGVPTTGSTLQAFAGQAARVTDEAPYRSLQAESSNASLNVVYVRPLAEGIGATFNGSLETTQSESLLGLPTATLTVPAGGPFSPFSQAVEVQRFTGLNPLSRSSDVTDAHLGFALNGAISGWRWNVTGNADRTESQTLTERGVDPSALQAAVNAGQANPFAALPSQLLLYRQPDQAKSVVTTADVEGLVNGRLFELPAGAVNAAVTVGAETNQAESRSIRAGVRRYADLSRDIGRAQVNVDVPLTRRAEFLGALGDLSLNFNAAADKLSDFGTLTTYGGGLNWSPVNDLRLIASFTEEEGAPTIQQLGDPEVATPFVRVFDYVRGETVEVTRTEGGNPNLAADNRRVFKLGLNWKPFDEQDLTFRVDYNRSRTRDLITSFPAPTAEIQAAFPERFGRDPSGRLSTVDVRPVNFDRRDTEEIRWGFNYSRPLRATRPPPFRPGEFRRRGAQGQAAGQTPTGAPQPGEAGAPPPGGAPPEAGGGQRGERAGGFGGGGGFGGPGGGFRGGRGRGGGPGAGALQFAIFHTWRLQDEIVIRPGVPTLDLLEGSAIGASGGESRHEVEAQATVSRNGLGARVVARWQSATEVNGARFGGQDLRFSDLTTVNVRLFADLGLQPFARGRPWLRGARATLSVDNLFDERLDVRDANGQTPISYQPDLIDPVGRTVRLSFRKLFF